MSRWYETFFTGLYGQVLARQFDAARSLAEARLVKRLLRVRKGQRVLDVPCGMGRLTLPLAQMGLEMTGVDLTATYLRRARRRADAEGLHARFQAGDMREIQFDGEFHGAFNWFGSFGYFCEADNLAFCRRVLRALRPGGRFLVEGIHKPWLLANYRPGSDEVVSGVRIVHRHRWDARASRIRDSWIMSRSGKTERHHISIRLYSGPELRDLLHQAGFARVELYGNPPLGRLVHSSRRLIAVAQKA